MHVPDWRLCNLGFVKHMFDDRLMTNLRRWLSGEGLIPPSWPGCFLLTVDYGPISPFLTQHPSFVPLWGERQDRQPGKWEHEGETPEHLRVDVDGGCAGEGGQPRLPPGTAALLIFRMLLWLALFSTLTWLLNCTYGVKKTACGDECMTINIVWAADDAFVQLRRLNLPQNNSEFTTYSSFFKAYERLFCSKECAPHDND